MSRSQEQQDVQRGQQEQQGRQEQGKEGAIVAGTALAAGVLAVTATLSLGLAAVGGAAVTAERAAGAADAAALAAADVASGAMLSPDDPCTVAARVAAASEAVLSACAIDASTAQVEVRAAYAGLVAVSRARAGPPDEP